MTRRLYSIYCVVFMALTIVLVSPAARAQQFYVTVMSFPSDTARAIFNSTAVGLASPYLNAMGARYGYFGFNSATPFVTTGTPLRVSVVSLERIALDSDLAFIDVGKKFVAYKVPLYEAGKLASSIDIADNMSGSMEFGRRALTSKAFSMRGTLSSVEGVGDSCYYLVDIPRLNLMFIGKTNLFDGSVSLVPLYDYSTYGFSSGQNYNLDAVVSRIRANMGSVLTVPAGYAR